MPTKTSLNSPTESSSNDNELLIEPSQEREFTSTAESTASDGYVNPAFENNTQDHGSSNDLPTHTDQSSPGGYQHSTEPVVQPIQFNGTMNASSDVGETHSYNNDSRDKPGVFLQFWVLLRCVYYSTVLVNKVYAHFTCMSLLFFDLHLKID